MITVGTLTRIADKEIVSSKQVMIIALTRNNSAHPCLDKNTCSDGEFCHRLVKPNEDTHDYECIDKDNDCIGLLSLRIHQLVLIRNDNVSEVLPRLLCSE